MQSGPLVESAPSVGLTDRPAHAYTQLLLAAARDPHRAQQPVLPGHGAPPSLLAPPSGCRFHPRCPYAMDVCKRQVPPSFAVSSGHIAACWLHAKPAEQGASENGLFSAPVGQLDKDSKKR